MGKNKGKNNKKDKKVVEKKTAAPKKHTQQEKPKKVVEETIPSSSEDSEEEEDMEIHYDKTIEENPHQLEEDSEEDAYDTIDVSFSFTDPSSDDFMDVRNFLQKELLLGKGKNINFSPLSEYICNQPEVGAMAKIDEQKDVYGFMSVINLNDTKNGCMKEVLEVLKKECPKEKKDEFSQICDAKTTGFLLNERMINFPQQLIPNLLTTIKEDIEWATTSDEVQNKELFKFKNLICICPCYVLAMNGQTSKKNKNENLYFGHFEDEVIQKYATINYSFHVPQMVDEELSDAIPQARRVLVFPYEKLESIIEETTAMLIE